MPYLSQSARYRSISKPFCFAYLSPSKSPPFAPPETIIISLSCLILDIQKSINSFAPDVVISYLDTPNIIASICKMLGGKFKLIVSERNTTQKITFFERLKFFLFYFSDFVVPNSYTQERFIFNNFANLKNKVKTIVNFTDIDYFFSTGKFSFLQQKVIVIVASIWPPKNVLGLIEAINILREKKLNFKVDWYGKTSTHEVYNNLCKNKISQYNLK